MRTPCTVLLALGTMIQIASAGTLLPMLVSTAVDPATQLPLYLLRESPLNVSASPQPDELVGLAFSFDSSGPWLQNMIGFGAGMPQASSLVLYNLKQANAALYAQVMQSLFGSGPNSMAQSVVRFPVGSCDFSWIEASFDDVAGDYDLAHFAPDAGTAITMEVLADARAINPNLILLASVWSPPAWLKTGDTMNGLADNNTLVDTPEARETYAQYLFRVAQTFADANLDLAYLSVQNEPLFGTAAYPAMFLPSDVEGPVGFRLAQLIAAAGLSTKLLAYDHNWNNASYPLAILDSQYGSAFAGTAFHCYEGNVQNQSLVHEAFPDALLLLTECTGSFPNNTCNISQGMTGFGENHEWDMTNILLGATSYWSQAGVKWLLALDENCGPVLPQVTYRWGRPLVSIPSTASTLADISYNQDYWTISHMSRYVVPGSLRVSAQRTGTADPTSYIAEAFQYTSDSGEPCLALVVLNMDHSNALSVRALDAATGLAAQFDVPLWGTAIAIWPLLA